MSDQFTIRGFTTTMRTRDIYACWPFHAGDATPDQVRSWLPPMTVPNFRWRADESGQSSSNRPDAAGEPLNPPSDEENKLSRVEETVSRLGDGQREPQNQPEEERLENPPVEEEVPQLEEGEREPENSPEGSLSQKVEEKLENPPVEVVSHQEDSVRESENLPSSSNEKEEEKLEMVCPVCLHFSVATLTAFNAHIDGCLREERRREMMSKSTLKELKKRSITETFDVEEEEHEPSGIKTSAMKLWPFGDDISTTADKLRCLSQRLEALAKPQKKRSIGEILEAAPKIDGGNSNVMKVREEEVKDEERVATKRKKKKKSKVGTKRSGVVLLNNKIAMMKRKKKMKMTKKTNPPLNNDKLAATKEDANKSIEQTSATSSRTLEGNGSGKEQAENCDLIEKQQEEAWSPIFGVLEINYKHSNAENHCDEVRVPRSQSHVEFFEESQPNALSNVLVSSLAKEQCTERDKATANLEANGKNVDNNTFIRKEVSVEEQFSNALAAQNFLRPCNIQDKCDYSSSSKVAPSYDKFGNGNTTPQPCSPHADAVFGSLSPFQSPQVPGIINTQVMRKSVTTKFIDSLEEQGTLSSPMSSNANQHAYNNGGPPSSCMVSANMIGSMLFSSQGNKGRTTDYSCIVSPKGSSSSDLAVSPTVRLMGKDVPIGENTISTEKKGIIGALPSTHLPPGSISTTRKRPATADLVDVTTRPNKLPNTGQSSRDAEELLDYHARLMMMINSSARSCTQQQNLNNLNPTSSSGYAAVGIGGSSNQNNVVISSSSGGVQGSPAGSKRTVEQPQNVDQRRWRRITQEQ